MRGETLGGQSVPSRAWGGTPYLVESDVPMCHRKWCSLKRSPFCECIHTHVYQMYRGAGLPRHIAYKLAMVRGKVPQNWK